MYLGLRRSELSVISEIADDYGISANHLVKVVHGLARGGFVRTYRGKGGGVALAREPHDINIGAVVRYTEGAFKPVECFRGVDNHCVVTEACRLAGVLQEACDSFLATLDRYSLGDLLIRPAKLRRHLGLPSARPGKARREQARRVRGRFIPIFLSPAHLVNENAEGNMYTRDPAFWRAGAISVCIVTGAVLIILTIDSLAAISPGGFTFLSTV